MTKHVRGGQQFDFCHRILTWKHDLVKLNYCEPWRNVNNINISLLFSDSCCIIYACIGWPLGTNKRYVKWMYILSFLLQIWFYRHGPNIFMICFYTFLFNHLFLNKCRWEEICMSLSLFRFCFALDFSLLSCDEHNFWYFTLWFSSLCSDFH